MPRTVWVAMLALSASTTVAAPVPKNKTRERIEKLYGNIVDPKGDCTFSLDGDKLDITLPANEVRGLSGTFDTAPRVERQVSGDFILTVRFRIPLSDKAGLPPGLGGVDDAMPFLGAGVLFKGKETWFAHGLSRWNDGGRLRSGMPTAGPHFVVPKHPARIDHCGVPAVLTDNPSVLTFKYTRRGKDLSLDCYDGDRRLEGDIRHVGTNPDDALTVALYAQHGSDKSHTVTFDEFSLEPLRADK